MMCERTFLHSSACVLRSPCGEARRASLLAPFGENQGQKPLSPLRGENRFFCTEERFADKPNLRPSGWLYPLRSTAWRISLAPLGKSPSYVVLASLRTKVKTVCFVSFIARSARIKERCSLRSHKGQNLCFL